jgi:hypothetical protein
VVRTPALEGVDLPDSQAESVPQWRGPFAELQDHVEDVIERVEATGWTACEVAYGYLASPPSIWAWGEPGVDVRVVEVVLRESGSNWWARVFGVARPDLPPEFMQWQVYPMSVPDGDNDLARNRVWFLGYRVMPSMVPEQLAAHKLGRSEPRSDPAAFLGDPVAALSLFALVGTFLGAILGKAAEDAYTGLKRLILKAPRKTRLERSGTTSWVVLHDTEFNTVIECPPELPVAAAVQLAGLAREGLRRVHLRWNSERAQWDIVGRHVALRTEPDGGHDTTSFFYRLPPSSGRQVTADPDDIQRLENSDAAPIDERRS